MEKHNFKTAKIFLQKMLQKKKSSYLVQKLVQNSKKSNEWWQISKCLGLSTKKLYQKFHWIKSGTIQFEPQESANIFKKLYSKIATDLVKKLIIAPNNFYSSTTKENYADIFNNEKVGF